MWDNLLRPLDDYGMQIHRDELPNGAVLVVGRDEHKREVMEQVQKLLAEAGSLVSVESLNAPGYFSLMCGWIKGMIQFETVKDQVEDGPSSDLFTLNEKGIESLKTTCEGVSVAFLYVRNYDPQAVEEWVRTKILST